MNDTPGPLALSSWMAVDPDERSTALVAEALGVSDQTVRNWRSGTTAPTDPAHRVLLAALLSSPSLTEAAAWTPGAATPAGCVLPAGSLERVLEARHRWELIDTAKRFGKVVRP